MTKVITTKQLLQRLSDVSDWRFAIGLHIRFANPILLYQTYPQVWIDYYDKEGLVFVDPAVRWAISNIGICDWSDLADQDVSNVFGQAADYGLRYGKVVSIGQPSRTIGFFTHPLREIEAAKIEEAQIILQELHEVTQDVEHLSEQELSSLRQLNIPLCRS